MRSLHQFTKSPSDYATRSTRELGLKKSFPFWPLVLSGMVVLLTIVAVLQYRWTTEVSAASEVRIGTELESLMIKWHLDFYGEFSAICVATLGGPDSGATDTWDDFLQRYVEWKSSSSERRLVDEHLQEPRSRRGYLHLGNKPENETPVVAPEHRQKEN